MKIDPDNRREFDDLSLQEIKDRQRISLWSGEKLLQARAYIDEKEHGPERAHQWRMFWVSVCGVIVAAAAIYFKVW